MDFTEQQINDKYEIDEIYFLGTSVKRQSRVLEAIQRKTNIIMAIRCYEEGDEYKRPEYDQWIPTTMLNPCRQILPYYDRNFYFCVGDTDISPEQQIKLMLDVAKKLQEHHASGKIHSNIHNRNVLLSEDLDVVEFVDSLKFGNKNTFYSSPENQMGKYTQANDVYSLGVMFYELAIGSQLEEYKEFDPIKMPIELPLFPEKRHIDKVEDKNVRFLLRQMLNRNYLERVSMKQVVEILQQMHKKKEITFKQNQEHKILTVFPLLEEEKEIKDKINEKLPLFKATEGTSLFQFHKPNKVFNFSKKVSNFSYDLMKKELKISHGQAQASLMEVIYKQNQLPKEIRQLMDMETFVLVLYHTLEENFDFCLNGELKIIISKKFEGMLLK